MADSILFSIESSLYRFEDKCDRLNSILSISTDAGQSWSHHSDSPWFSRWDFEVVTSKQPDSSWLIYIIGGVEKASTLSDDIYLSEVVVSADCGKLWRKVTTSAPWGPRGCLHCTSTSDGALVLYGGIFEDLSRDDTGMTVIKYEDVWRSLDKGLSWELLNSDIQLACVVYVDDKLLAISKDSSLMSSRDLALTWFPLPSDLPIIPSILISDHLLNRAVCIGYKGVCESLDGGATWELLTCTAPVPSKFRFFMINFDLLAIHVSGKSGWVSPSEDHKLFTDFRRLHFIMYQRLPRDLVFTTLSFLFQAYFLRLLF